MNIDATLFGKFIALFALIIGAVCFYIGRRKTKTPILAGLLGMVLSIIPIIALVYLAVLILKKDISSASPV